MLLQVLDDGRLTDGQGHTVNFRNTLIVMTSNLGSEFLANQPEGQDTEAVRDQVMAVVRASFRPEFLNRVDEIILFHRLKRSDMTRIVDIQMGRLRKLLEDRKITIVLEPSARDWLAEKGWDPAYGARPLKRVIQKSVQDPLAELILSGRIKDGEKVEVSATKQGLSFNGKVAGREVDGEGYAVWVLPAGTKTRALRFSHTPAAGDWESAGWLGGVWGCLIRAGRKVWREC